MPDRRLRVGVELELGDDTIRGSLDDGSGSPVAFTGWLELMAAFDSACARAATTEGGPQAAPEHN